MGNTSHCTKGCISLKSRYLFRISWLIVDDNDRCLCAVPDVSWHISLLNVSLLKLVKIYNSQDVRYLSCNDRKHTFWHVRSTNAQITLRICTVIRNFIDRMKKPCIFGYPKYAQWRYWSDCANAQSDQYLRWAQCVRKYGFKRCGSLTLKVSELLNVLLKFPEEPKEGEMRNR